MDQAMNEKMRKVSAIMLLSSNYDNTMPDDLLDIWLTLLFEYSAAEVEKGVAEVIKTYKFKTRPPFAILREAIDKCSGKKELTQEMELDIKAEAEWDKLIEAITSYGIYKKPELNKTTEHVLMGMGGWEAVCAWETAKLDFKRKIFLEKWKMAYGNYKYIELGAAGIIELAKSSGPTSVSDIFRIREGQKGIAQ